jgi:hypothetical protein
VVFFFFFFFISNVYSIKTQRAATPVHREYTREPLNHRKKKQKNIVLKTQKNSKQTNYSMPLLIYRVCSIIVFISSNPCSRSSKLLAFRSLQRHHIKHNGTSLHMFNTLQFPNCPFQLPNKTLTLQGITHATPNN